MAVGSKDEPEKLTVVKTVPHCTLVVRIDKDNANKGRSMAAVMQALRAVCRVEPDGECKLV